MSLRKFVPTPNELGSEPDMAPRQPEMSPESDRVDARHFRPEMVLEFAPSDSNVSLVAKHMLAGAA